MTEAEVLVRIDAIVQRLLSEKGAKGVEVTDSTELLGDAIDIDSLDLATLVRELEEQTGHDPFADGFVDFQTAGELARLYAR
jgi:acyl carrier protein